jgi:hypothetical protein
MNSELVQRSSDAIARELMNHSQDRASQIDRAFVLMLGRHASEFERTRSVLLIEQVGVEDKRPEGPLSALIRGLITTRAFVSIE